MSIHKDEVAFATRANATAAVDSATIQVKEAQEGVSVAQAQLEQERAHMADVKARLDAASPLQACPAFC